MCKIFWGWFGSIVSILNRSEGHYPQQKRIPQVFYNEIKIMQSSSCFTCNNMVLPNLGCDGSAANQQTQVTRHLGVFFLLKTTTLVC